MMNADDTGAGGRALAIDPGTKRTGFAVSDELGITAQGLPTFEHRGLDELVRHVGALVAQHRVSEVVVGLPLSMSGGEIEGTRRSRELAARIERECGAAVVLWDERMTSREAERIVVREGGVRGAADIDRIAAVLILQGYLEERSRR